MKSRQPQNQKTAAPIRSLVRRLNSPLTSVSLQAEEELQALGPQGIEGLLREYERIKVKLLLGSVLLCFLTTSTQLMLLVLKWPIWLHPIQVGALLLCGLFGLHIAWSGFRSQRRITRLLFSYDDPRVIGPLIDLLSYRERSGSPVRRHLVALLLRVQESGMEMADIPIGSLNLYLGRACQEQNHDRLDVELIVAMVQASPCIGNVTTLKHVLWLSSFAVEPIRTAARGCLARLEARVRTEKERLARQKVGEELLRASAPEQAGQETLLRPAAQPQTTQPDQLLRPVY
jgi:hypothetical protein